MLNKQSVWRLCIGEGSSFQNSPWAKLSRKICSCLQEMIKAKHFLCKHINQVKCVLLSNVKQWVITKCTYSVLSQNTFLLQVKLAECSENFQLNDWGAKTLWQAVWQDLLSRRLMSEVSLCVLCMRRVTHLWKARHTPFTSLMTSQLPAKCAHSKWFTAYRNTSFEVAIFPRKHLKPFCYRDTLIPLLLEWVLYHLFYFW